jgi:hypothetical protein
MILNEQTVAPDSVGATVPKPKLNQAFDGRPDLSEVWQALSRAFS